MIATRTISTRAAFLPIVLAAIALTLVGSSSAHAGEWVQRSCSVGTEYISQEGWESKDIEGYTETPLDNCKTPGAGLRVDISPTGASYMTLAGEIWAYKPPAGSTIAGGTLSVDMTAREGVALVGAKVKGSVVELGKCESPGCLHYTRDLPITAVGATEIYEQAACFGKNGVCHPPEGEPFDHEGNGLFSAEAELSSAQILLSTNAVPSASGLGGTLLNSTVTGKATLSFTATDAGPGIYQVRVKVNGEQALAETPNLNEGKCVSTGTSEGARAFNYTQPCPTETPVNAEINTAGLPDGTHALTVELEDAAGDVATIYSGTLTTVNHATVFTPTVAPVERGPCNGTPCDEAAKLAAAGEAKTFTRALGHSPATLTGRLTSPTGTPIHGAQVKLLQQIVGSAAVTQIASTTTSANGSWSLKAPAGASRLLQVAFYSHTLDTTPASTLDFHENVQGAVSMHAPHRAWLGHALVFSGQLAGGYVPAGGESVQMEIFYGGRWRTIEVLPTNSKGRWAYKYVFSLGVGASYLFRAVTVPNAGYPFLSTHSKPIRVTVQQ